MPKIIKKLWGKELIYKNDKDYCVKLLFVDQGKCCSIHLHENKTESFMAHSGRVLLEIWDQLSENFKDKELCEVCSKKPSKRIVLTPYHEFQTHTCSFITILPRTPHRFYGLNDCDNSFFEASTEDSPDDSYRALKSMGIDYK